MMAKKFNLGDSKLAFRKPNCQATFQTKDKNLSEMIHMRREILGEDKDVIHVDKAEGKITQNLIRKALERVTSVSEAKEPAKKFKHHKGGDDGSLLYVLQKNWHLIVTFLEVHFGENFRSIDPRGKIANVGKRIMVRNSYGIQPAIIATRSPTAFFLLNHEKRKSPKRN